MKTKFQLPIAFLLMALPAVSLTAPLKPRIVVLTDISPITAEPDDFESTIRLLAHADLFEIEGLVASTGWSNSGGRERPDELSPARFGAARNGHGHRTDN